MSTLIFLILTIGLIIFLVIYLIKLSAIDIQPSERIAVFRGTEFLKIIGPGKHYKFPYNMEYWFTIKLDEVGIYQNGNTANFGKFKIPVAGVDVLQNGDKVFIKSFNGVQINVNKINT
jgi:regulator of protease activity HflC (stomatin/prohibitin superfamily)